MVSIALIYVCKYATGDADPAHSFYFKPSQGSPPFRASNLGQFLELAATVDDETWLYHVHRGDFAHWFRDVIKDKELATEADRGQVLANAAITESRKLIHRAIEQRYLLPS